MTENERDAAASAQHDDHAGPVRFDAAFWDERYRSSHSLWSGNPNPTLWSGNPNPTLWSGNPNPTLWSGNPNPNLVAEAGALVPGAALDVGAGEGADAIWPASRGWRVTAVDISSVALGRAAGARRRGRDRGNGPDPAAVGGHPRVAAARAHVRPGLGAVSAPAGR